MKKLIAFLVFALLLSAVFSLRMAFAQGAGQADLLERAYSSDSFKLLSQFFDNWHQELVPNEADASNPWLKEAYKVYAAVCQPEILKRWHVSLSETPFLVVQSQIEKVGYLQQSNRFFRDSVIPYDLSFTVVDSAVAFRPNLLLDGVTTVYLTDGYEQLVNDFFTTFHLSPLKTDLPDITDEDIDEGDLQSFELPAEYKESSNRGHFLRKYVSDINPCYFSGWRIRPFFTIDKIIFSPSRKYAIVEYTCHGESRGGTILMGKKHGKWVFVKEQYVIVWSHGC